jgi:histone H3/H4
MAEEEINNADVVPEDNGVNSVVENEEDDLSPFPKARVVRLMREKIKDKIIRSEVKDAMNMWLGDITRKIAKEMSATQYASVSLADFQRATKPYDMIEDIVKDEQRLLLSVQKLKEDSDHIIRELNRFFTVLKGRKSEE